MSKDIQAVISKLYKEIADICKRNNITFYLEGGSVIGALRHRGYIPWDDDMDLVMSRDNFERFVEAFEREKPENRELEYPEKNTRYPLVTIKYHDCTTTNIFRSLMIDEFAGGVYIDIFILDPIPLGRENWFKQTFLDYTEFLCDKYTINKDSSIDSFFNNLEKTKSVGRQVVLDEYRKKLFCYSEKEAEYYQIRWGIAYQTAKIDYYGEPRWVQFEDYMVPIPSKAEKILEEYFGDDWFILPEEDQQISHNLVRNLNKGFKIYKKDYLAYIDVKKYKMCVENVKIAEVKKRELEKSNRKRNMHVLFLYDSIYLNTKLEKDRIEKAYKKQEYGETLRLLNEYIKLQTEQPYKRELELDVGDSIKIIALESLINGGKYYIASKLIESLSLKNNIEEKNKIQEEIDCIRKAKWEIYYGDYKTALEIIDTSLQKNANNLSAYKIKIEILLKNGLLEKSKLEKTKTKLQVLYNKTEDVELIKYIADICMLQGSFEEARCYYINAKSNNRNGIMLLEIKDELSKLDKRIENTVGLC